MEFTLPSGNPATALQNYFNKYRTDPVLLKLSYIADIYAKKHNYTLADPEFNEEYKLGPGGRAEDLKMDLLQERMLSSSYSLVLQSSLEDVLNLLENEMILTSRERKNLC